MYHTFMQQQAVINGNLVSYFSAGSKDANKTLVFLHGWRSQKEVWMQVASSLYSSSAKASEDRQVTSIYAIDLPGFGQSPAPKEAWNVGDYAECVKQFIEKLELKNIYIVGHSFGGRVGIKLASQHKGLVEKLVLVGSAGFKDQSLKKHLAGFLAGLAKPFFKFKIMQGVRKKIYFLLGAEDYAATPQLRETFKKVVGEDLSEDMERIKCPTLIINGEQDAVTPPEFGRRMHGLIPGSQFQIFSGAGHYCFLDKPEEFVKVIEKFI